MMGAEKSAISVSELTGLLDSILESVKGSQEIDYRIRKLIGRTTPLTDKMFLKTVKGQEMILQCIELTRALEDHLASGLKGVYLPLTELEKAYEELLRRTYEFRVKAG